MAEAMIAHPEIVGVAPFLTEDSLPKTWPQLYKKKGSGPNDLNDVNFLDNLATLWRAEWCATQAPPLTSATSALKRLHVALFRGGVQVRLDWRV